MTISQIPTNFLFCFRLYCMISNSIISYRYKYTNVCHVYYYRKTQIYNDVSNVNSVSNNKSLQESV